MRIFDVKRPEDKEVILATMGDWHIGASTCDQEAVEDFVAKCRDAGALVMLMGDLCENALVNSAGSTYEQHLSPQAQVKETVRILEPIKDQIIGAVGGNHGARTKKVAGLDPDEIICWELGIPYFGATAAGRIQVGERCHWKVMAHHGAGGGSLLGSKLNVVAEKMTKIVPMADLYLAGHTHADVAGSDCRPDIELSSGGVNIQIRRRHFSGTGSLLDYDTSYAERMLLPPASKVQVFHYLGDQKHIGKKNQKYEKRYRRVPHWY